MSLIVFLSVLFAAACHAGWNAGIKRTLDPLDILNPGVKVPLRGQNPLTAIKYDPSLAPLPPRARAALDRVERERAYSRFRLDLLD